MTDDQHAEGTPASGGRWDPLPQGDYDDGATAFVKLPEGGIEALLAADSPLAAPGHGYVPPRIAAAPAPPEAADGAWAATAQGAQWPDPHAVPHDPDATDRFTYDPQSTQHWHTGEEQAGQAAPAPGQDVTGQWSIPVAGGDLPDESGEFTTSSLVQQWGGTPPATLPGGAAAPWATEGAGQPWGQQPPAAGQEAAPDPAAPHAPAPHTAERPAGDTYGGEQPAADTYGGEQHAYFGERARGGAHAGPPAPAAYPGERAPQAPHAGEAPGGPEPYDPSRAHPYAQPEAHRAGPFPAPAPHGAGEGHHPEAAYAPSADREAAPRTPDADTAAQEAGTAAASAEAQAPASPAGGTAAGDGHGTPDGQVPEGSADSAAEPAAGPGDAPQSAHATGEAAGDAERAAEAAEAPAEPSGGPGPDEDAPPAPRAAGEPATASGRVADPATAGEPPAAADPETAAPDQDSAPSDPETAAAQQDADPADDAHSASPHDEHPLASYVLRVNGVDRPVTDAWIGESLLYVLRERLGLAGAKDGCSQGECGACNVQVDGRLVASCLVPAATAAGSEVRTVEGLAVDGQPSDVQRALARCGAVQCGFCVPGMAMTVHDLLEGNPAPTELETRQALCGNLCRCSGYRGVLEAVKEVVAERETHTAADESEPGADEPRIPHQAGPGAGGVHPSAFDPPHRHDPYGQDGGQP
ncbi:2Fe-2S iron-sulfur cluster-binding protein [Streptomyces sp. NPDC046831]|uniref:2Fe-2S iron-sulfur cluster-binding protein n=1 Tax=Streptomyces sp. NPDC046831 TaxID=3154805 RepID=UPI0033E166F2